MHSKIFWLILEPYVHVEIINNTILFYNFLNKKKIVYNNNNLVSQKIYDSLQKKDYVIELTENDIKESNLYEFINTIRLTFSGDIIPASIYPNKPIQILQSARIINTSLKEIDISNICYSEKIELSGYLTDINIFINSNDIEQNLYDNAYKQFLVNYNSGFEYKELEFDVIYKVLTKDQFYSSNLNHINILGGNIFKYSKIDSLLKIVESSNMKINYHFRDFDFLFTEPNYIRSFLTKINNLAFLKIFFTFPVNIELIAEIKNYINEYKLNLEFCFIIENEEHLNEIEQLIDTEKDNYTIQPFFNGNNINFFEKNVFITEDEILEQEIMPKDSQIRQQVNPLFFGELTILSNGDIHDNVNLSSIGNIYSESIHKVILGLLKNGNNAWKLIRKNIEPCCNCYYYALCTPISSYELAIKRFNLCNVIN